MKLSSQERFKSNMEILLDIITEMFEEAIENNLIEDNTGLFNLVKLMIRNCSCEKMINNFIKKTYPHWEKLRDRDLEYFKSMGLELFNVVQDKGIDHYKDDNTKDIFSKIKDSHLESFKKILESSYEQGGSKVEIFDDEKKEDIWKIIHSFVKISVVYVHDKRNYKDGKYTSEFFPEVKVKENITRWGIKNIKF